MIVNVLKHLGSFASNKDEAKKLREDITKNHLLKGEEEVILDFKDVDLATQSCIHALIADILRSKKFDGFKVLKFKNCNENIKPIVQIVFSYCQE